ncbi:hypothetical protein M8J77_020539 [Diaphorina citri]|nr:hypothetical protein M8J77_020539 [Diaphorina citri]
MLGASQTSNPTLKIFEDNNHNILNNNNIKSNNNSNNNNMVLPTPQQQNENYLSKLKVLRLERQNRNKDVISDGQWQLQMQVDCWRVRVKWHKLRLSSSSSSCLSETIGWTLLETTNRLGEDRERRDANPNHPI